jgi:pullulanase/glycogen debranching enzyme
VRTQYSLFIYATNTYITMSLETEHPDQSFVNDIHSGDTVTLNDTVQVTVKKSELDPEQAKEAEGESHVGKTFAEMEEELKQKREAEEPLPMPLSR